MEHDAVRELYNEVYILGAVSQEDPSARSGKCLESWKSK